MNKCVWCGDDLIKYTEWRCEKCDATMCYLCWRISNCPEHITDQQREEREVLRELEAENMDNKCWDCWNLGKLCPKHDESNCYWDCNWSYDRDIWTTSCNRNVYNDDIKCGMPERAGYKYCPFCGKPLQQIPIKWEKWPE